MPDTNTHITGGSQELVAFEMMKFISEKQGNRDAKDKAADPKTYIFRLYSECFAVVSGQKQP
jgi:hypothetical protein